MIPGPFRIVAAMNAAEGPMLCLKDVDPGIYCVEATAGNCVGHSLPFQAVEEPDLLAGYILSAMVEAKQELMVQLLSREED